MMSSEFTHSAQSAQSLIEALPYIQKFRGRTMVIKYGGSAMENEELMQVALRDIVFLEAVGINPVIVHGGGKAINRRMMERGLKAQFINGLRVTDAETVSIVNEVLNRDINPHIASTINELGGKAQSVQGADVFQATKAPAVRVGEQDVDLGFVGEVTSCAVKDVQSMIAQEIVPVISPIGKDAQGQLYNINADTAAAELAIALDAYRILYLSDVNGILLDPKDPSSTVSSISPKDVLELRDRGVIDGGMIPKVESCLKALQASVEKVHLIDGRIRHSLLLELFTDHGIGTEIVRG